MSANRVGQGQRSLQKNRHRLVCSAICLFFVVFSAIAAAETKVDGLRLWRAPDHTRLVFDLNSPVEHNIFKLESPRRLVIDISDTEFDANTEDLDFSNTPIDRLRYGRRDKNDLRVVLDLGQEINPRSFALTKQAGKPDRLVIDLYDIKTQTVKTVDTVAPTTGSRRDIIVAIDAGHGGEDPGALGPKRIREKDVVLKIAQELRELIDAEPGYTARMVRTGDYYIPLRNRRNKARELRADLFISVHADAFKNPQANGASVFALSNKGATSETARFLASKENEADLIGGVGDVSLDGKDNMLQITLVDLSMNATLAASLDVGDRVLKRIGGITRLHKHQVEQAGFAVLKSPDVPSILVETGFISNPQEAKLLNTRSHRRKLANAIFHGVKEYFYDKPPAGSYVAWQKNGGGGGNIEYTIARGDTLSSIARRYRITVSELIEVNGLNNTTIRVGQKLTIPTS